MNNNVQQKEPWQIEAEVFFRHLDALGVKVGRIEEGRLKGDLCYVLPYGVVLHRLGADMPEGLTQNQCYEIKGIMRALAPLPESSAHQRKMDARRRKKYEKEKAARGGQ